MSRAREVSESGSIDNPAAALPAYEEEPPPIAMESKATIESAVTRREVAGYFIGIAGFVGMCGVGLKVLDSLFTYRFTPGTPVEVESVRLAAQASVTIALMLFFYQLIRAAERMVLPESLLFHKNAPLLLGIKTPTDYFGRSARASRLMVKEILELVARLKSDKSEK